MKKHTTIIIILAAFAALFAGISCQRAETEYMPRESSSRVPVALALEVNPMEAGTPETKGAMEPDNGTTSDDQIANFLLLQFDGVDAEAPLVGGQLYFDHWPLTADDEVTLVGSDTPNTIVVLANTFGTLTINNGITLEAFLAGSTSLSDISGIVTASGGDDYFRMSGTVRLESVTAGSSVNAALKRNCAKVVVNVNNATASNTGDDVVTFSNVQLRGLNGKYYYLAHIGSGLSGVEFTDPYNPAVDKRFDNPAEEFPAVSNTSGAVQTYTYYVPANLRGTITNDYQSSKGADAPEGATRFCIYATYGASGKSVNYTYYLGGNLTNDFNLRPNYKYTYNITIDAKGNGVTDSRVEDMGDEVIFGTDANCYMVHPPLTASRVYAFPVRRAATFWNEEGVNGGLYGASAKAGYEDCAIDATTAWTAEILWSDFDMSAYMSGENKFLAVDSGTGFDPAAAHAQPYIKVRVSAGMKGNVVVAVKKGGNILWSWHLWITDYDPDVAMAPIAGKYIYGVPNGEIHRYNNDLWNKAPTLGETGLADGFIMDRNLGAKDTKYHSVTTDGGAGLFYQFGRKDPSPGSPSFYLGGIGPKQDVNGGGRNIAGLDVPGTNGNNIRYTVLHPTVWIGAPTQEHHCWTLESDDLGDEGTPTYYWNDKKYWRKGDPERHELKKSIYDPCPPGWKVPLYTTYSGFITEISSNTEAQTYTVKWSSTLTGWNYYPEGYVNRDITGVIFLPATGYRSRSTSGSYANSTVSVQLLTNRGNTSNPYRGLQFYGHSTGSVGSLSTTTTDNRSFGFKARCVRE